MVKCWGSLGEALWYTCRTTLLAENPKPVVWLQKLKAAFLLEGVRVTHERAAEGRGQQRTQIFRPHVPPGAPCPRAEKIATFRQIIIAATPTLRAVDIRKRPCGVDGSLRCRLFMIVGSIP